MKNLSAADVAAKYAARASAAAPDYTKGVQAVTTAPGQLAAAAKEKMRAKVNESLNNGKWETNVSRVSLSEWKDAAVKKGGSRYASGVQAGQQKMQNFMAEWLPHEQQLDGILASMPSVTVEDGIARSAAAIRHNASFKRSGR
jgi:hypothetical protein